jgi:hypothetical protein
MRVHTYVQTRAKQETRTITFKGSDVQLYYQFNQEVREPGRKNDENGTHVDIQQNQTYYNPFEIGSSTERDV